MSRGAASPLIGKWRITEMGLWDKEYLDMVEPAYIQFKANGLGEFKFGCVAAVWIAPFIPMRLSSPGKAATKWTPSPETDGPNSATTVRSTAKSASISATNQPSKLAGGEFFNGLLEGP